MIEIKNTGIANTNVYVPGSKSYSHRALIAAGLANGQSLIQNTLKSDDTDLTKNALRMMGIKINETQNGDEVYGTNGKLAPQAEPIYLGNSGTSMRLLSGIAALNPHGYTLTGSKRMCERPIQDLLDALSQLGVKNNSINKNGCPPIEIQGGQIKGGKIKIDCSVSSQYLSALLLVAPLTVDGIEIQVTKGPVSKPYIDLTIDIMELFNIDISRDGYQKFIVPGGQAYRPGKFFVEPDCSQASYFWGAAAITGKTIKVMGINENSKQGDIGFANALAQMGCHMINEADGIAVQGGALQGIEIDMAHMPDVVPTLAVVAAFAKGQTTIRNISHLRAKESDRILAVTNELSKMGIHTTATQSDLFITGGTPNGATIHTYDDHRIAMCFAIAGLKVPGVKIEDEKCVEKSFPQFWEVFEGMYLK